MDSYKTRIKDLLHQNCDQLAQRRADSNILLKSILDQYEVQLTDTSRVKSEQTKILQREELSHRELILQMKKVRDVRLSEIREEFRLKSVEIINYTENQLNEIRQIMGERVKENLKKLENNTPMELMEQHDKVR